MNLVITGRPIVKKNNQRVITSYTRQGKKYTRKVNTPAYNTWHDDALDQFLSITKPAEPIDYPVNMRCYFVMPTRGTVDLSALYEGIQDLLVEVGVLSDDNYRIIAGHDGSRVFYDKENPRMEISIKPMANWTIDKPLPVTKKAKSGDTF